MYIFIICIYLCIYFMYDIMRCVCVYIYILSDLKKEIYNLKVYNIHIF